MPELDMSAINHPHQLWNRSRRGRSAKTIMIARPVGINRPVTKSARLMLVSRAVCFPNSTTYVIIQLQVKQKKKAINIEGQTTSPEVHLILHECCECTADMQTADGVKHSVEIEPTIWDEVERIIQSRQN